MKCPHTVTILHKPWSALADQVQVAAIALESQATADSGRQHDALRRHGEPQPGSRAGTIHGSANLSLPHMMVLVERERTRITSRGHTWECEHITSSHDGRRKYIHATRPKCQQQKTTQEQHPGSRAGTGSSGVNISLPDILR